MAFKVRTVERENVTRVSTLDVPQDFLEAMEKEYSVVKDDPTREMILEGENAKETTLYVQWAKYWGMNRPNGGDKLSVFKQPTKKGGSDTEARLLLKPYDPNATKRGRKPTANAETPAETPAKAEKK